VTVIAFASVKGSPGVTTLTCLVAAEWPGAPAPIVVESDPAGGDLAARFELSSRCGWPALAASLRREGSGVAIEEHVQPLPGGLDVLVGTEAGRFADRSAADHLLERSREPGARDLLVDLGRLPVREAAASCWLEGADEIVLVSKGDAPSLIGLQLRTSPLVERYGPKLGLVVVGSRRRTDEEIEAFTSVRLLTRVPSDPLAAAMASGERRGGRRLSRSRLVTSAARLAAGLARSRPAAVGAASPVPLTTNDPAS
jgi:MinD-like ATPase involved in chromosome partitioning or flagellar assembly